MERPWFMKTWAEPSRPSTGTGPAVLWALACLIAVFLIGTGEFKRMHSMSLRFFWATGQQIDFAQPGNPERMAVPYAQGNNVLHRLLQQWEGFGDLPCQASCIA